MIKIGWIAAGILLLKVSCMAYNLQIYKKSGAWWGKVMPTNRKQGKLSKYKPLVLELNAKNLCTSVEVNEES
jgi:hypothetical protein